MMREGEKEEREGVSEQVREREAGQLQGGANEHFTMRLTEIRT